MSMTLVQTVTVGAGGAALIEFTGIPQDGTDLLLTISLRNDVSNTGSFVITFNNNSSNLSARTLFGNGSSASSINRTDLLVLGGTNDPSETANTFSSQSVYIPNYAGSTAKSVSIDSVKENNATTAVQAIIAGLWNNTAAITSIQIANFSVANFVVGSTASLYKITKA